MATKIVILEDNPDRVRVMRDCLMDGIYTSDIQFFANSQDTIAFLGHHLSDTLLISLDHDLDLISKHNGEHLDPGTGREVADYLAGQPPACLVVIHTTNSLAAQGMELVLKESGWKTHRVIPFDDLEWISTEWLRTVSRAIVRRMASLS
jgi:hypothetical protein